MTDVEFGFWDTDRNRTNSRSFHGIISPDAIEQVKLVPEARGEQTEDPALPVHGSLRGDNPLSSNDKEIK